MTGELEHPVKRRCRWRGGRYLVERGAKADGCPTCAPTIDTAIAELEPDAAPAAGPVRSSAEA